MSKAMNEVKAFLSRHGFSVLYGELHSITEGIVRYMKGPEMLYTYLTPPSAAPASGSVIVIDAGGTNFRSCVVTFAGEGEKPVITDMQKCSMPGMEKEYTKEEFYASFAQRIERLKGKADTICLCFSYAVQMLPSGDGKVIKFSKEIKALDVCGTLLGESLSSALRARGWQDVRIVIVNDTTAALIAGKVFGKSAMLPASYASFILGTGINSAFADRDTGQIVVTEIGSYTDLPMSDFDKGVDEASTKAGAFILEKQCSGAYLGHLAGAMLRQAAAEGLLHFDAAGKDKALLPMQYERMTTADIDRILYTPFDAVKDDWNREVMFVLLDAAVARAAVLSAAVIAASAAVTGKGESSLHPVRIECNGTTFCKTYKLRQRVEAMLEEELCARRALYWELCCVEDDITLGTAAAYNDE